MICLLSGHGIHHAEGSRIKHDPAAESYSDDLSILDVDSCATAVAVVDPEHRDEFSATLNELSFHPPFV